MTQTQQKYAIVTGVSLNGIGYYVAQQLAAQNYIVTLASRNKLKTNQVIKSMVQSGISFINIRYQQLDVSSFESIHDFVEQYIAAGIPLHVLVNNAGIWSDPKTTVDGLEMCMTTSHTGHFYFIQLLQNLLIQSQGRIVNVNSFMHAEGSISQPIDLCLYKSNSDKSSKLKGTNQYGSAKLYQMLAGRVWHRLLHSQGVSVYNVNPGKVRTDFVKKAAWGKFLGLIIRRLVVPLGGFVKPAQGAEVVTSCATVLPDTFDTAPYLSPHKQSDGHYIAKQVKPVGVAENYQLAQQVFDATAAVIAQKTSALGTT